MTEFVQAFLTATIPIGRFDSEIMSVVAVLAAGECVPGIIAIVIGRALGWGAGDLSFWGRQAAIVLVNALLGLPPVVVGLAIYLLLTQPRRWLRGPSVHAGRHGDSANDPRHTDRDCPGAPRTYYSVVGLW
jgi:ABC-type tungstate transport system substrate-binding protein